MKGIRVVVIMSSHLMRDSLVALLNTEAGLTATGSTGNQTEALTFVKQTKPDVILLDAIGATDKDRRGLVSLLRALSGAANEPRIVVLLEKEDTESTQAFERFGVSGFVYKDDSGRALIIAIQQVCKGETWLKESDDAESLKTPMHEGPVEKWQTQSAYGLTKRELQVVALVTEALKNNQIANELNIEESTVRHHLSSIFEKCGVKSRAELMLLAFKEEMAWPGKKSDL